MLQFFTMRKPDFIERYSDSLTPTQASYVASVTDLASGRWGEQAYRLGREVVAVHDHQLDYGFVFSSVKLPDVNPRRPEAGNDAQYKYEQRGVALLFPNPEREDEKEIVTFSRSGSAGIERPSAWRGSHLMTGGAYLCRPSKDWIRDLPDATDGDLQRHLNYITESRPGQRIISVSFRRKRVGWTVNQINKKENTHDRPFAI
jgi:hypothetical protein